MRTNMKSMNTLRRILCLLAAIVMVVLATGSWSPALGVKKVQAASTKTLDEILDYRITVDMLDDGSMQMVYDIKWKVLDSKTEGPLSWVKIGVGNTQVDEIRALSNNIKKAKYYGEGGCYVRIDFKKKYYKNEIVQFTFSLVQHNMFTAPTDGENHVPYDLQTKENIQMAKDNGNAKAYIGTSEVPKELYQYWFIPGWFPEIEVDHYCFLWNTDKVVYANTPNVKNGYLVWEGSLAKHSFTFQTAENSPCRLFSGVRNNPFELQFTGFLSTEEQRALNSPMRTAATSQFL